MQIVEQRKMRDRDAMREARRTARILEIGDIVGLCFRQLAGGGLDRAQRVPAARRDLRLSGSLLAELGKLRRVEEQRRIAALQLHTELVDISLTSAETGRQRKRHGPGAGINRAEKGCRELRSGFRHKSNSVTRLNAKRDEAAGDRNRVLAQLRIGIGAGQRSASVMEVEAAVPARGVIQRLTDSREGSEAAG